MDENLLDIIQYVCISLINKDGDDITDEEVNLLSYIFNKLNLTQKEINYVFDGDTFKKQIQTTSRTKLLEVAESVSTTLDALLAVKEKINTTGETVQPADDDDDIVEGTLEPPPVESIQKK